MLIQTVRGLSRSSKLRLAWDVFMVWAALINLWLILFDLTYLWLRPYYFSYIPVVTSVYDPVKGISANPLTSEALELRADAMRLSEADPESPDLTNLAIKLRAVTLRIFAEDPFAGSGQEHLLGVLRQGLADQTKVPRASLDNPVNLDQAVNRFWPLEPEALSRRLRAQDPKVLKALQLCYHRSYALGGELTDYFWLIDLPFLTLFWIEFLARWRLAIKREDYASWFFFPIVNWYDVLGLIPIAYFRVFRLLRVVSMYMRLRRSELSVVGQDVFSRTVAYFSNIITEEVSDRVALRILAEFHEEIADGTHARIVSETVQPRRSDIQRVLVNQIQQTLTNTQTLDNLRSLLRLNLTTAIEESEALSAVPLPNAILRPLVRTTGEVILETTLEAVSTTLNSAQGRRAVEDLAGSMLDDLFYGPGLTELESLTKEISLQVIEHMQEVVAIKKWMLPHPDEAVANPTVSSAEADFTDS